MAYSAGVFLASVMGLTWWNAGLRDAVGRVLTVEQLHVVEYAGLGALAACSCRAQARSRRLAVGLAAGGVGFLDEALQAFVPQRYFQWSDVFLNWLGIAVGMTVNGRRQRHQAPR